MIRNVFGKALTEFTLLGDPDYKSKNRISREDLAKVALAVKNSHGKGQDEQEVQRYLESLRDECKRQNNKLTLGWIYNASGGAITLVNSIESRGGLAPRSPYPVRIENGQWGMILFVHSEDESSGIVFYEGLNLSTHTCYWCVAWKLRASQPKVCAKIVKGSDWDKQAEYIKWENVNSSFPALGSAHSEKHEGWRSVISTSHGPDVVFEALLTMQHL